MRKNLLFVALLCAAVSVKAQNLISNGDFSEKDGVLAGRTGTEWGMWTDNGGKVEIINGKAVVTPGGVNAVDPWHLQLEQWGAQLGNDTTYIVKFEAKAAADRTIQFTIEDPNNGYRLLGTTPDQDGTPISAGNDTLGSKWTINITTVPTVYTRTFTVFRRVANTAVKCGFLLCASADVVIIDDVSIEVAPEETQTGIKTFASKSFSVYPNPAHGMLKVSGTNKIVNIYDVTGKLKISSSDKQINISKLVPGIYFAKSGNEVTKIMVK